MARLALAYVGTLVAFCALDFVWLGTIAKPIYQGEVGALLLPRPNLVAAALLYLMYAAALVGFAIVPALESGGVWRAAATAACLGLVVYGVYDLTNLATLKGWTIRITAVDMTWGTAVSAASAAAGYGLARLAGGTI